MIPQAREIFISDDFSAYVIAVGQLRTNCSVVINHANKKVFIVDCAFGMYDFCKKFLPEDCKVTSVLVTHAHWDHIGDVHFFKEEGATIYCPKQDVIVVETPDVLRQFVGHSYGLIPSKVDCAFDGDETIIVNDIVVSVSHIAGHNPGSSSFYIEKIKTVFTGDTLFAGCIGRSDFFGGNEEVLKKNIKNKILTLPEDTKVVPGHGNLSIIGAENSSNAYFI